MLELGTPVRRISWPPRDTPDAEGAVTREWLVTNGLGGYASGTVAGAITRRYHGLLIAALPAPFGRTVMLSHVGQQLQPRDGGRHELGGRELSGDSPDARGTGYLVEFRLEAGLPVWRYDANGLVVEKRVLLVRGQNTVHIIYELLDGADVVDLALRPSMNFRPQETAVSEPLGSPYELHAVVDEHYEIVLATSDLPPLRLRVWAPERSFTSKPKLIEQVLYPVEESRGYPARGDLWSPGYFRLALARGVPSALVASTEPVPVMNVMEPLRALEAERERRQQLLAQPVPEARDGVAAELVLAADQFIITPPGGIAPADPPHRRSRGPHDPRSAPVGAHAFGDEVRTVIAGYHWFTEWGRDTMIALEGLTLVTGRHVEASYVLRTFAHHVRDGLVPNLFPEGVHEGLYHTADASLWFFHAIDRYVERSGDRLTLRLLYPTLERIIDCHIKGTRFGIHVDEADGLLVQGAPGYQLTWMDAKVDDWVVTPRRGKAVEINALWFNALELMERWTADPGAAAGFRQRAARAWESFNQRFWYERGGYLYDVVDGEDTPADTKCRPNQILSIALPNPVLDRSRWKSVTDVVAARLLTPVGLRSLDAGDPEYRTRYFGDLRARDAAYHQGTVWAWLVGPFLDAWLKVYPEDIAGARHMLDGFVAHLDAGCVGSVSEVFDAEDPFTPRGCIAQAWSVAEVLRAWVKTGRFAEGP
ncbi:MAG TPA: amylo-alpha-1,6-glucosidase [Vicinamibacterales bacterium]|nr:amylo-alpha-1,6-glucosidase [Vicinamibacterales bacterium]